MTELKGSPSLGDVWDYPYLWSWQSSGGETEGRKTRPCALALVTRRKDGQTEIILVPVTTKEPAAGAHFIEVPQIEKKRAGLDEHLTLWVICDEFNSDLPGQSFYFVPGGKIGAFSIKFTKQVQAELVKAIKSRKAARVERR
ncbi:hypothetical protein FMN50_01990 [Rhodobacterales bacterium]|nr:hypothetical protein FMN50_01990 [Rhodobacterales bacterium]